MEDAQVEISYSFHSMVCLLTRLKVSEKHLEVTSMKSCSISRMGV